jgi:iron complex transport system permease protein
MAFALPRKNRSPDRIVLNLAMLQGSGLIGPDEIARLRSMAEQSGLPRLAANVFLIFGVLLVVGGILALRPPVDTGLLLAASALAAGSALMARAGNEWRILGRSLVMMGILGLCGWLGLRLPDLGEPWPRLVWPGITALLLAGTLIYRDAFLATLATIALGNALGGASGYWHASYFIAMQDPALSIGVFTALAGAVVLLRNRIPAGHKNVAVLMARTSFFLINFGFWIGSLWGDYLGDTWLEPGQSWEAVRAWRETAIFVPDLAFSIGWTIFLLAAMAAGIRTHQRFLANTAVVFLCIHFYTQMHETLLFQPAGVVASGFILVGIGMGLVRFDRWQRRGNTAVAN